MLTKGVHNRTPGCAQHCFALWINCFLVTKAELWNFWVWLGRAFLLWRGSPKWVEKAWLGTWDSVASNYTTIVTVYHRNFSFWPEAKCTLKQTSFESLMCFEMILKSTSQIRFGTSQIFFFFKWCFAFRPHFFAWQLIWLLQLLQVILPRKSSSCFLFASSLWTYCTMTCPPRRRTDLL